MASGQEGAASFLPAATEEGVLFRCRAPGAQQVYIAGTFNNWANNNDGRIADEAFRMDGPDTNGVFTKVVPLGPGTYHFQFAADGRKGHWFVPDEIEERDADSNGVIRIAQDGSVIARTARRAEWKPQVSAEGVIFHFYAPDAHVVYLAGSFNNWGNNRDGLVSNPRFAMRGPTSNGMWEARMRLSPGAYAYQFVIDGDRWVRDPNEWGADTQNHSVVVVQ